MKLFKILKEMGLLRILLLICVIFFNSVVPTPGTNESYTGIDALFHTVIPSLTPLIFMVLLLDVLMTRVMIDGKDDYGRVVAKRNSYISLVMALSLVIFWVGFYLELIGF